MWIVKVIACQYFNSKTRLNMEFAQLAASLFQHSESSSTNSSKIEEVRNEWGWKIMKWFRENYHAFREGRRNHNSTRIPINFSDNKFLSTILRELFWLRWNFRPKRFHSFSCDSELPWFISIEWEAIRFIHILPNFIQAIDEITGNYIKTSFYIKLIIKPQHQRWAFQTNWHSIKLDELVSNVKALERVINFHSHYIPTFLMVVQVHEGRNLSDLWFNNFAKKMDLGNFMTRWGHSDFYHKNLSTKTDQ